MTAFTNGISVHFQLLKSVSWCERCLLTVSMAQSFNFKVHWAKVSCCGLYAIQRILESQIHSKSLIHCSIVNYYSSSPYLYFLALLPHILFDNVLTYADIREHNYDCFITLYICNTMALQCVLYTSFYKVMTTVKKSLRFV